LDLVDAFDPRRVRETLADLSSDAFAGRRIGTPGHAAAVERLMTHVHQLGLDAHIQAVPAGPVRTLLSRPTLSLGEQHSDLPGRRHRTASLVHRRHFAEHPRSALGEWPIEGICRPASRARQGDWALVSDEAALTREAGTLIEAGVAGILVPQAPGPDGWLAKRLLGGPTSPVPVLAISRQLAGGVVGRRLSGVLAVGEATAGGWNILATLPGRAEGRREPLVLVAHHDAVGDDPGLRLPGASDNALGVALAIETARLVARSQPDRPFVLALVDGEEVGARGSATHARGLAASGVVASVITVDMAGFERTSIGVEPGPRSGPLLAALDAAGRLTGVPLRSTAVGSDNRSYAAAGHAAVGLGLGADAYHSPADTSERVPQEVIERAGRMLVATAIALVHGG
jgi:hypothetical protein